MNVVCKKAILKALTCLILILTAYPTQAVAAPWYERYFQWLNGSNYQNNCSIIDYGQKIRCNALALYYRTTHNKADLNQALSAIINQLQTIQKNLINHEQEMLVSIKEKYGLSGDLWQKCLSDIEQVKKMHRTGMLRTCNNVIHDQAIPNEIMQQLITMLTENNINPHSIHIRMASPEEIAANRAIRASARITIGLATHDMHNNLLFSHIYHPAAIVLFPGIHTDSNAQQTGMFAHEVQHLVSLHDITTFVLGTYLEHHCGIDRERFEKSVEYQELCRVHEAQADILSAINNPQVAHCQKECSKAYYYPGMLYEEHFYALSTIDMLWKLHDELEALYFADA